MQCELSSAVVSEPIGSVGVVAPAYARDDRGLTTETTSSPARGVTTTRHAPASPGVGPVRAPASRGRPHQPEGFSVHRRSLRKKLVDSTDERNMMDVVFTPESRNGTDGTAWVVEAAEARAVGAME